MARISAIYFYPMRKLSYFFLLLALPLSAQVQNWDTEPFLEDGSIRFHDDLDFFLNGYNQAEIKAMRQQVSLWQMNFDRMIRSTIRDIQTFSEGNNLGGTTDFTLSDIRTGEPYHLGSHSGKLRAFMFGSITNPPSRAQLPYWDALRAKYDTSQVELFVIYGKELHPSDKKRYKAYPVPATMGQKEAYATEFAGLTQLPVLVDGPDNKVLEAYGKVPNGAFVIDGEGRLIFRSTWADNRKIEHILDTVLKWEADGKPRLKGKP